MDIMKFVTDNYVWFIVGGVITLMALIGYVAERTDFGRKEATKKEKKSKDEENNREAGIIPVAEPVVPAPVIPDADNLVLGQDTSLMENDGLAETGLEENNLSVEEDLSVPLELTNNNETNVEPVEEDLSVPLVNEEVPAMEEVSASDISEEPNVEVDANDSTVEEDNQNKPIIDVFNEGAAVDEVIAEEPVNEANDDVVEEDIPTSDDKANVDLPNIDTLKDNDTEEDVWKF